MSIIDLANDARTRITEVDLQDINTDEYTLVDVRENQDYDTSHLPNAVNIPFSVFENEIQSAFPTKTTPLAIYCTLGNRSAIVADILQKLGYESIVSIRGGLSKS